jgi:ketosteroid isomerase-like protein
MRHITVGVVVVAASVLLVRVPVAGQAASVEQTIMQLERDGGQALIKKDIATMGRILADDWVAIDYTGHTIAKTEALADLKSSASSIQSMDFGPMKVRVFGDSAVVTGSDTEKSTYKGKDSSGHYVWTDVFVKRDGRWQIVASQSIKTP